MGITPFKLKERINCIARFDCPISFLTLRAAEDNIIASSVDDINGWRTGKTVRDSIEDLILFNYDLIDTCNSESEDKRMGCKNNGFINGMLFTLAYDAGELWA